jgi:hypothetical protein
VSERIGTSSTPDIKYIITPQLKFQTASFTK